METTFVLQTSISTSKVTKRMFTNEDTSWINSENSNETLPKPSAKV